MDYEHFKSYMKESVEKITGRTIRIYPVLKNNSLVRDGFLLDENEEEAVSPAAYLDDYYEEYQKGASPGYLVNQMVQSFDDKSRKLRLNPEMMKNYSSMRPLIAFKLISHDRNRKLLERIPHRPFLDMEIVYYVRFFNRGPEIMTMLIGNDHLELWNTDEKDIYETAKNNAPLLAPARVQKMQHMLDRMADSRMELKLSEEEKGALAGLWLHWEDPPFYVVTNETGLYGAASVLYEGVMEECSRNFSGDIFVIPSSIHEVLLLPADGGWSVRELNALVCQVNEEYVEPEEVLSDHVYMYRRAAGCIENV